MSDKPACRFCFEPIQVQHTVDKGRVFLNPNGSKHNCPGIIEEEHAAALKPVYVRVAPAPPPTGEQLRDEGTAAVSTAEDLDGEWMDNARIVMDGCASSGLPFNADEIRAVVGDPQRANAMGALFLQAVKSKLIERYDERKMTRPKGHARRTATYIGRKGD